MDGMLFTVKRLSLVYSFMIRLHAYLNLRIFSLDQSALPIIRPILGMCSDEYMSQVSLDTDGASFVILKYCVIPLL